MARLDQPTSAPASAVEESSGRSNRGLRALWIILITVVVASFAALLYYGREIYQMSPPVPERVVATDGTVVFTGYDIRTGQDVWRSVGG